MDLHVQPFILVDDVQLPDESQILRKGTIVYRCIEATYGVAIHDWRMTGEPHMAVTLDRKGGYPFFTMAERHLKPIPFH